MRSSFIDELAESITFILHYVAPLILVVTLFVLIADNARADPHTQAPDFMLPTLESVLNGDSPSSEDMVSLSAFAGKIVYLDFWASWCGPCRYEMPLLNQLRNEFKAQPFEVIGINVDADPADAAKFLATYPVDFPVVSDPVGKTSRLYRLTGFPSGFLISPEGQIVESTQGFHPGYIDHLRAQIEAMIK